jgi:hypothetical protein
MNIFNLDEAEHGRVHAALTELLALPETMPFTEFAGHLAQLMHDQLPEGSWRSASGLIRTTLAKSYALAPTNPFYEIMDQPDGPPVVLWAEHRPLVWFNTLKRLEAAYQTHALIASIPPISPN